MASVRWLVRSLAIVPAIVTLNAFGLIARAPGTVVSTVVGPYRHSLNRLRFFLSRFRGHTETVPPVRWRATVLPLIESHWTFVDVKFSIPRPYRGKRHGTVVVQSQATVPMVVKGSRFSSEFSLRT